MNLDTHAKNTWCPGCGNFGVLNALKQIIASLVEEGTPKENIVVVSGIGCSSKIIDYINVNTFSSLHGRPVASAEGIKIANPELEVIACLGDGGSYNEGISHLVHAAKRNIGINVLVHDNRNFALTTSQFTATSPKGFQGGSTPEGSIEEPFDPLEIMLASRASFIARSYAFEMKHLQKIIKKAVDHKGFSFVDILQPCITFFDTTKSYKEKIYKMENDDLESEEKALEKTKKWNYGKNKEAKIPLGVFYQKQRPAYEKELLGDLNPAQRKEVPKLESILQ